MTFVSNRYYAVLFYFIHRLISKFSYFIFGRGGGETDRQIYIYIYREREREREKKKKKKKNKVHYEKKVLSI